MAYGYFDEEEVRKEASSRSINRTIEMVEDATGLVVPEVGFPTAQRKAMVEQIKKLIKLSGVTILEPLSE